MIETVKENFFKTFLKFPKKNILLILFFFGFGEWLISDVIHFSGGSLGFIILCFGSYFYLKNDKAIFKEPNSLKGWIELCEKDLNNFKELEKENKFRRNYNFKIEEKFNEILEENKEQRICLISDKFHNEYTLFFNKYIKKEKYFLDILEGLPSNISGNELPDNLIIKEAIFYHINLPLSAKDLLWISKFPDNLPVWLTISSENNFLLKEIITKDYLSFYSNAILERKGRWPPHNGAVLIRAESINKKRVFSFLSKIAGFCNAIPNNTTIILGPVSSPIERKLGKYRGQILLLDRNKKKLHNTINKVDLFLEKNVINKMIKWQIDIDPLDMS
mgnify:CR=1 FL=1